jgi:hypothetical protein
MRPTLGEHELEEPVLAWSVETLDGPAPMVELLASLRSQPMTPLFPMTRGQTATTLAIRMDPVVAMKLYEQLGELGRRMGWRQPEADASQV